MHTQKPKGYGFVAFATKDEAEEAMKQMNGKMIGSRTIRTNWAVRRPPQPPGKRGEVQVGCDDGEWDMISCWVLFALFYNNKEVDINSQTLWLSAELFLLCLSTDQKPLNYEEVNMASSELNTTVYVGGITLGLCGKKNFQISFCRCCNLHFFVKPKLQIRQKFIRFPTMIVTFFLFPNSKQREASHIQEISSLLLFSFAEELLRAAFGDFGDILECRIFKEKGYAFIRFDSHEAATRAIVNMHGKPVGDQPCKCSWGKESTDGKDGCQVRPAFVFMTGGSWNIYKMDVERFKKQLNFFIFADTANTISLLCGSHCLSLWSNQFSPELSSDSFLGLSGFGNQRGLRQCCSRCCCRRRRQFLPKVINN